MTAVFLLSSALAAAAAVPAAVVVVVFCGTSDADFHPPPLPVPTTYVSTRTFVSF